MKVNMLKKILTWLGLTTIHAANEKLHEGISQERTRQQEFRDKIELTELQSLVGKPVIGFSNEWENIVVGVVTDLQFISKAQKPIPVVFNYLTGKEQLVICKLMPFTEQRLKALIKLDPYERWCLISPSNKPYRVNDITKKPKLYTEEEIFQILENKGFLKLLEKETV